MKVCVVDLDRTVIFSQRVLEEYPTLSANDLVNVEYKDGELVSSTSKQFFNWIRNHNKEQDNILLIANTARSIAEFNRVELAPYFDYSIVSNGGWVLSGQNVADGWEEYRNSIGYDVSKSLLPPVLKLSSLQQDRTRVVDNSYIYSRVKDEETCDTELASLREANKDIQYLIVRDKVYVNTNAYSKAHAINWLTSKLNTDIDLVCGDAPVDIPMLKLGKVSAVPFHGEIVERGLYEPTEVVGAGALASIDIMHLITKDMK